MENLMKMITARSESVIKALILCRELSDGFQYTNEVTGEQTCELCRGDGKYIQLVYTGPEKTQEFLISLGLGEELKLVNNPDDLIIDATRFPDLFNHEEDTCPSCNGKGITPTYTRTTKDMKTAKDKALIDILEEYEDYGRLVIYCGFTASVDKCVEIVGEKGWQIIRVDGRGWESSIRNDDRKPDPLTLIDIFQTQQSKYPKVCFIGHPGSSSTGLTLTASSCIVYYSNTFNGEDRQQSEDRIHRLGMDENRGAKIIDLIHLPTDQYVLDNLVKKKKLQEMSIGQMQRSIDGFTPERFDYE
jgi:SNF2 family DNA or RNA helicase